MTRSAIGSVTMIRNVSNASRATQPGCDDAHWYPRTHRSRDPVPRLRMTTRCIS